MDVSIYDGWIIFAHGEYLVAVAYEDTRMCRWSTSPFDALLIHDVNEALRIAQIARGKIHKFNPITGRILS